MSSVQFSCTPSANCFARCQHRAAGAESDIARSVISFLLFTIDAQFLFTVDLFRPSGGVAYCGYRRRFADFLRGRWFWIDAFVADFVPFSVVFVGNCLIVGKLVVVQRQRAHQLNSDAATSLKVSSSAVFTTYTGALGTPPPAERGPSLCEG